MGRLSERFIALLLLLFLLIYVGYQIFTYYYVPLQTETVYQYSVTHSISAQGVAVRNEVLIDQSSAGVESNIFEDGVRVAAGQAVVEFYSSSASDRQVQQMRTLELEIAALQEAQNTDVNNYSNADTLNRDIRENIGSIAHMSSTGRFSNMTNVSTNTISLINKRQIAVGKEVTYQQRITKLQSQYNELSSKISITTLETATAPRSGYFVKTIDGMENLSPEIFEEYTLQDYCDLIEHASPQASSALVGKIVTNSTWHFVATIPKDDAEWIADGMSVHLEFESVDGTVPGRVLDVLTDKDSDQAIVILAFNQTNNDLLSLRKEQATIHIRQYTGLRINTSSLRIQQTGSGEEVRGVYVLSKGTVRFRRIDPIYEDSNFIISREDAEALRVDAPAQLSKESDTDSIETAEEEVIQLPEYYEAVSLYDQIIVKGKDLYHGKVVE